MKSADIPSRIAVVGTDTDVGKTVLSLFLMRFFFERGFNPFYLKPFQTGCDTPCDDYSDARFIYENIDELRQKDPAGSVIACYKTPKAPLFAARDQGEIIELAPILKIVEKKAETHSPLIIEAAGGVLVPINEKENMIDLVRETRASPVIAARAGLGTINHTLLTVEALKARGISPLGIILIKNEEIGPSDEMIAENIEAIETASAIKVGGVIGRISNFKMPDSDSLKAIGAIFPEI